MRTKTRDTPRERILNSATHLFARHGFHATGINTIIDRAGVGKKTLYRHFRSKDDLVLAVLSRQALTGLNEFVRSLESMERTPARRILAAFDFAEHWFCSPDFYGCLFINAISEYNMHESPIRRQCIEYKRRVCEYFEEQVRQLELDQPAVFARQLALLYEGAIVVAQVSGRSDAAQTAKRIAEVLLRAQGVGVDPSGTSSP